MSILERDVESLAARLTARPVLSMAGWSGALIITGAALMSFLAVLTLAASMAADRLAAEWRSDLAGVATVRVTGERDDMADRLDSVIEVLRTTQGISRVRILSDDEQSALIAPWLGDADILDDLPAPRLIDLALDGDGPDADALQARLDLTVSGATYDDHGAWRAPLAAAAQTLETLALGATVIVMLAAAGVVVFAARATIAANRTVIETVRLVGAQDRFIARAFVLRIALRSVIGAFTGALVGAGLLMLIPGVNEGPVLPRMTEGELIAVSLSPGFNGWLILALGVPVALSLLATLATAISVRIALRRLP
ncbi:MAG: FtsX-like permease family protein [Pseudomonadota bacterium]